MILRNIEAKHALVREYITYEEKSINVIVYKFIIIYLHHMYYNLL